MTVECASNAFNDASPRRGVFWVIDGKLVAYPFHEGSRDGIAKSGNTYNHKKLWSALNLGPEPYNYHPRGRVDVTDEGVARIYVNPSIDADDLLPEIKRAFNIADGRYRIIEDHSRHYRYHLDEGWSPDR